jgi:hypothetical protein
MLSGTSIGFRDEAADGDGVFPFLDRLMIALMTDSWGLRIVGTTAWGEVFVDHRASQRRPFGRRPGWPEQEEEY